MLNIFALMLSEVMFWLRTSENMHIFAINEQFLDERIFDNIPKRRHDI